MTILTKTSERTEAGDQHWAPEAHVLDASGQRVALSGLWAASPVLLVFLRHFGCIFCRERLKDLEQHQAAFSARGIRVVAVGVGEPKHIRRYAPQLAPSISCLASADGSAHAAFGTIRAGLRESVSPQMWAAGARAARAGVMQGAATGDQARLGATFLIGPGGLIHSAQIEAFPGDHADLTGVLEAAQLA